MDAPGSTDPITVVSAADAAYALPLAVMLRSVIDRLGPTRTARLHVIDDGLGPELRERVEASLDGTVVRWIVPDGEPEDGLPLWGRMPATTYHKLVLPSLLSGVDRALWLDADLVSLEDVGTLWDMSLERRSLVAVTDPFVSTVSHRLGVTGWRELEMSPEAPYFNAGVLLLDLDRWRAQDVTARALEYLHRFRDRVFFHDQEALNAVLVGDWTEADERWNRSVNAERLGLAGAVPPAILHYSGTLKPWTHRVGSRLHAVYYSHLDRTAWRGWRPEASLAASVLDLYQRSLLRRVLHPLEQIWFRRWVGRTRSVTGPRLR